MNSGSHLEFKAYKFAELKHRGQNRKYTGDPYIYHPVQVAIAAKNIFPDDIDSICAAYLHDTIEDCGVTYHELRDMFGLGVANIVLGLTSLSKQSEEYSKLPRRERHRLDIEYLKEQNEDVHNLKGIDRYVNLCDCPLDNFECIAFLKKCYLKESLTLASVLRPAQHIITLKLNKKIEDLAFQLNIEDKIYESVS